jgi:transposase, IS5 family
MTLRQGTIVDATLIAAPSSTKNEDEKRDPEMHQTKKSKQGYYGAWHGGSYSQQCEQGMVCPKTSIQAQIPGR